MPYDIFNRESIYRLFFWLAPLEEYLSCEIKAKYGDTSIVKIKLNMLYPATHEARSVVTMHDASSELRDDNYYCALWFDKISQLDADLVYQKLLDHAWEADR